MNERVKEIVKSRRLYANTLGVIRDVAPQESGAKAQVAAVLGRYLKHPAVRIHKEKAFFLYGMLARILQRIFRHKIKRKYMDGSAYRLSDE